MEMKRLQLEHVDRLSRGKRSGINAGSRSVGHYLRPFERATYQRALSKGYLDITDKNRANLWHVWEKACIALNIDFLVLVKDPTSSMGTIYRSNKVEANVELTQAKQLIKSMAKQSNYAN